MFRKLNLTVNQGRVLVTGVVENPEDRVEAIRLAWQPKGVKQVINEVRVGNSDTIGSYAQDTWIAGQLRTRLTFEKYVQSINYSIEVVQGTVYLMGVAQGQQELDRTINIARRIKGVKEVISYVKLAGLEPEIGATQVQGIKGGDNMIGPEPVPLTQGDLGVEPFNPPFAVSPAPASSSDIQSEVLPP